LAELLQIFVRSPGGARFFTWEPPTNETPVAHLFESLRLEYPEAKHGPIDLVDESSGKMVSPTLPARAVDNRVLAVRTRYITDAVAQADALRKQEGSAFDYNHEPGASTIELVFRSPGLDRVDSLDGSGVVVKGHHRAMLILPGDFPAKPPHILWQSSVFHPNLSVDLAVWPPGYDWARTPSSLGLVGALMDTLSGANVRISGRFVFWRRREINRRAAGWYRTNRRGVAALAAWSRYAAEAPIAGYPLDSTEVDWELRGELSGTGSTVFLSRRAIAGMPEFGSRGAAWLIGQKSSRGQSDWLYVDRLAPGADQGSPAPASAVGVLLGPTGNGSVTEQYVSLPLRARVLDGNVVLRLNSGSDDLTGFMVEAEEFASDERVSSTTQSIGHPITIRGPSPQQSDGSGGADEPESEAEVAESVEPEVADRLFPRDLEAPVCMYCGIVCVRSEDWGACPDCGFVVHEECLHQLGGCPNTDCPRSVLKSQPVDES